MSVLATAAGRRAAALAPRSLAMRVGRVPVLQPATSALSMRFASDLPDHILVKFPSLSPTMTEGTLQKWNVAVGDEISAGDSLADVETDKATMSFDSNEDGVVARLFVEEGTSGVAVGAPVLVLVDDADSVAAFEDYEPPAEEQPSKDASAEEKPKEEPKKEPKKEKKESKPKEVKSTDPGPKKAEGDRIFASPLARKLAERASIQLKNVTGTGPNGRITKADIEAYEPSEEAAPAPAASAPAAASSAGDFEDKDISGMRKTIARRLQESKQTVPHYYLTSEVRMDKVMALRKQFNEEGKGEYKLSLNDFVIKASAAALRQVKECNSAWMDTFIRQHHTVDISVAVSTDAGLITPIVFDADAKGLAEIAQDVRSLAERAREGGLKPEEYQGGTFTISNLGMYGVKSFSAIINPPQACILAVGATEEMMVPDNEAPEGFSRANVMSVTLSCDHRVVDGAVGARWLQAFKKYMENPVSILL